MRFIVRCLILLPALALLLAACAAAPLRIVRITPADGATNANPQAGVLVEFDQPVTSDALQAAVAFEPAVPFRVTVNGNQAQIMPEGGLQYGVSYRITINASLRSQAGGTLDRATTVAFQTSPYLNVTKVTPDDGSGEVALRPLLLVEFSAPAISDAVLAQAASDPQAAQNLPQPLSLQVGGTDVPGVGRWLSPTSFGFSPAADLEPATTYEAVVRAEIAPDGSARMTAPRTWAFTTTLAPPVRAFRPFADETSVPPDTAIEITLASGVSSDTAAKAFTLIEKGASAPVQGTIERTENGFRFRPAAPLKRGASYQARFAPGIPSRNGTALNPDPITWGFVVLDPLTVEQVEPAPDSPGVPIDTRRISVRFNLPMVALTTVPNQANLPQPLQFDPPLPGSGRWLDTRTYVYEPSADLLPSTAYRVQVAAGLSDPSGGRLEQAYTWSFRTIVPEVVQTFPQGDVVAPTETVRVIFNQPMDLAGLQRTLRLQNLDTATDIAGTLTLRGNEAIFTPAAPLERGATYALSVNAGAPSAQGVGTLEGTYTDNFRVAPLPTLLASFPGDGADTVDPGGSVQLTFSAPMNWDSVWSNLTITPQPTGVITGGYDSEFYLYFSLAPETDYTITIGANARDFLGVPIGSDQTVRFRTAPLPPTLEMVGVYRIGVYNAYVPVRVPIRTVNIPQINYQLFVIDPGTALPISSDYEDWINYRPDPAAQIAAGELRIQGERNRTRIDFVEPGRLQPGLYFLQLTNPDGGIVDRQLLSVSPYALTLKRTNDQIFVWAADLASGQPVANLAFQAAEYAYDTGLQQSRRLGTTDTNGVLQADFTSENPFASVYVWAGDASTARALTMSDWGGGISPYDFNLSYDSFRASLVGHLASERPIYRPGQIVYMRGVMRLDNDSRYTLPPRDLFAELSISDPNGNLVISRTLQLSEFGTFYTSLKLDESAEIGFYSMSARLVDATGQRAQLAQSSPYGDTAVFGSFTVAAYRKPVFQIDATPTKPDLVRGDPLEVTAEARYFAGGVLANAPLRWRLLSNPFFFGSDAAPGFTFDDPNDAYDWYLESYQSQLPGGEIIAEGSATTDAQGRFTLQVPAATYSRADDKPPARILTVDIEITDVDGQVVATQAQITLHPGAFYIGGRVDNYVARINQPQQISLITLDPQGVAVPNQPVQAEVFLREWYTVREQAEDGRFYFTSNYTDTLVQNLSATTDAQGRGAISFTPTAGGTYRVTLTGRDAAGNNLRTSVFVWAYGGDVFWGLDNSSRLDLIADKNGYNPGDTAAILVTAPYPGMRGLLTIERGRVIEHRTINLQGTSKIIQVPISADYAPNVYVGLTLIQPSTDDTQPPDLRVGLVNLPVSTAQQQLAITITPDTPDAGPGEEVTYTIRTTDYTGQGVRAEIALALVDKAVLALAPDSGLSLLDTFYGRRGLGVFTSNNLTLLVNRINLALQAGDKGGGGAEGGPELRREFPDTAYWNPALVTDSNGNATITVKLPDSLTTWRMIARAVTADTLVGEASNDLLVSRPLLVRPALPRFLTVGDQVTLQSVIQNNTPAAINAKVTLELDGPAALLVQQSGPTEQTVNVAAGTSAVVRWPMQIARGTVEGDGTLIVRMSVEGGGLRDAAEQTLPVQRFLTPEVVASAGQVTNNVIETLAIPPEQAGTDGEIAIVVQPSLAAGINGALTDLETFKYEHIEQTVSRFMPAAAALRVYRAAGQATPEFTQAVEQLVSTGLQRLYATQKLDGGWGWWIGDDSSPWLSAHAVQGMLEAQRAGYAVDPNALTRALDYLAGAFNDPSLQIDQHSGADTRAYVLFVLSEGGRTDPGRAGALYERRVNLSVAGRAYLLMALRAAGDQPQRVATLLADLNGRAVLNTTDAYWQEQGSPFGSDAQSTAVVVQALLRTDPNNLLIPNAVRYLLSGRSADGQQRLLARTTYETALAVISLAEYLVQSGELQSSYTYRVALDDTTLREESVGPDNLADPVQLLVALGDLKPEGSRLLFQRQAGAGQTGAGRLYYTLRARYYQDATQVDALDRGIIVQRSYIAVDQDTLTPTGQPVNGVKLGDVVQVQITLQAPDNLVYLTVEDMLPAGLEPLNTSLRTTTAAAQDASLQDVGQERPSWWYFGQTTILDDRVALFATNLPRGTYVYTYLARASSIGAFQAAPTVAYQTYAPEVFGRSGGATFTVTVP